ncbi:hypothetical protein TanjilG_27234 [Lupinus angustifolius]|uniref:Uncharacterized protein n=1 Tax=Lupinus angustifolius TaxID=3871 RepID=A0A394D8A2_LUPAN|nr:hypothetical protein TanjilG_27234 [Lupinus angustifolius]
MQKLEVIQDFYLFELRGVDMVLGLEWLASLGKVRADFGRMKLSIKKGEQTSLYLGILP